MKTIYQKISTSFLMLIIISLLVVMILFNIAIRVYSHRLAQKELQNAVTSIEMLIRRQLLEGISQDNSEIMRERLKNVRVASSIFNLSSSVEFLIVDGYGTVYFPENFDESFLSSQVVEKAVAALENRETGQIVSFRVAGTRYYTTFKSIAGNRVAVLKLIFISSSGLLGIVRVINIILLSIIALAIAVGSFVAVKLSKSITKPISDLSKHAKEIGQGHFLMLPANESSAEIHDLTNNMNEMSKRLIDYDRTQKMFLQNASHEIRTPLMSIQGYAEGIAKGIFSDTSKTAEIICEESKRLNTLVEELLTLSRIENNAYEQEFSTISLPDMMKEYIQKMIGYALQESKSLELTTNDNNINVYASDSLLSAAVINIISNCIKFARSKIAVSVVKRGNIAIIRISDDGDGISQKDLPHIFDRFYKGKKGNFGLGLSIAKSAIEFMGGSIKAYNENGAVFELELPICHNRVL